MTQEIIEKLMNNTNRAVEITTYKGVNLLSIPSEHLVIDCLWHKMKKIYSQILRYLFLVLGTYLALIQVNLEFSLIYYFSFYGVYVIWTIKEHLHKSQHCYCCYWL